MSVGDNELEEEVGDRISKYTYVGGIYARLLADPAASAAEGADGVRLVHVDERLVLLAHPHDLLQVTNRSLLPSKSHNKAMNIKNLS